MLNFGLTELRLVARATAGPTRRRAGRERRRCGAGAGASVRHVSKRRWPTARLSSPRRCAAATWSCRSSRPRRWRARSTPAGRSAILFGAERSGLESDEVALAGKIVTVPINPEFGSLNLAQAVILIAYEWSKRRRACPAAGEGPEPPAPQADLEGLIGQLYDALTRRAISTRPSAPRRRAT